MLVNVHFGLAALAVSAALTRACLSKKKAWRTGTDPCAGGGRNSIPGLTSWLWRAAASACPGSGGAREASKVCFKRVTVSTDATVANARRFQCPVSQRQTGSGPIWAGPAWSLCCKIPPQLTYKKMLWSFACYCSAPGRTVRAYCCFPGAAKVVTRRF